MCVYVYLLKILNSPSPHLHGPHLQKTVRSNKTQNPTTQKVHNKSPPKLELGRQAAGVRTSGRSGRTKPQKILVKWHLNPDSVVKQINRFDGRRHWALMRLIVGPGRIIVIIEARICICIYIYTYTYTL